MGLSPHLDRSISGREGIQLLQAATRTASSRLRLVWLVARWGEKAMWLRLATDGLFAPFRPGEGHGSLVDAGRSPADQIELEKGTEMPAPYVGLFAPMKPPGAPWRDGQEQPSIWVRLRVRWKRRELDETLARGANPVTTEELALRAEQLQERQRARDLRPGTRICSASRPEGRALARQRRWSSRPSMLTVSLPTSRCSPPWRRDCAARDRSTYVGWQWPQICLRIPMAPSTPAPESTSLSRRCAGQLRRSSPPGRWGKGPIGPGPFFGDPSSMVTSPSVE